MRALPVGDARAARRGRPRRARPRPCTPSCCAAARRARCSGARDRPRGPDGPAGRPRRPGPAGRRADRLARCRPLPPRARDGWSRSRSATTARTWPTSPRCWGVAPTRRSRGIHAATEFRVAFCGFAPGFGYLTGLPGALRRAAPGHPAHGRPGGLGGARGPVHRRVPALVAGRLAADRHHGRRAVGPRARARRAARRPGTRVRFVPVEAPHDGPRARRRTGRGADHRAGPGPPGPRPPRRAPLRRPRRARAPRWPTGWSATRPRRAVLETTLNGCARAAPFDRSPWRSTARPARSRVDGRPAAWGAPVRVPAGRCWTSARPLSGVRSYVAVSGGVAVEPVLGSRSTDLLSGLGPPPLADGTVLPLGPPDGPLHARVDVGAAAARRPPNWSCA